MPAAHTQQKLTQVSPQESLLDLKQEEKVIGCQANLRENAFKTLQIMFSKGTQ